LVKVYYPEWLLSIDGGADGGVEYAVDKADWDAVRTTDRNTTRTEGQ
jgi:hypothetical protein